jgi:hypothetical protein
MPSPFRFSKTSRRTKITGPLKPRLGPETLHLAADLHLNPVNRREPPQGFSPNEIK